MRHTVGERAAARHALQVNCAEATSRADSAALCRTCSSDALSSSAIMLCVLQTIARLFALWLSGLVGAGEARLVRNAR